MPRGFSPEAFRVAASLMRRCTPDPSQLKSLWMTPGVFYATAANKDQFVANGEPKPESWSPRSSVEAHGFSRAKNGTKSLGFSPGVSSRG